MTAPGARSAFAPSIAVLGGSLYVAWRGAGAPHSPEDDQRLYLREFRNGAWRAIYELPGKSMFAPALAVHDDSLFLAWHGEGNLFTGAGHGSVSFGVYRPDAGFTSLGIIPQAATAGPPALAAYKGLLYGAWRGLGNITLGYRVPGNEHWILCATYDPQAKQWSSEKQSLIAIVHANSTAGPCLAAVNDKLYALWRGTGSLTFFGRNSNPGDPLIYYASFDGLAWSAENLPLPTLPGARTAWGASATEWGGELCAGWRGDQPWDGAAGDQALYFATLAQGRHWRPLKPFGEKTVQSAFSPALAADVTTGKLWIAWRGPFDSAQGIDDQQIYLFSLAPEPGSQ